MLDVESVDFFYGDVQALWEISFHVEQGEIVTLVGANGAGKTTALRTISGLGQPAGGRILFCGSPIHRLPPHKIVEMGIVHIPEGRKLWPAMSVAENLDMGAFTPHARRAREETLRTVFDLFPRLAERPRQPAGTLSGGEQQMLAIARGLMSRPRLLMLDEPSLGLAPITVAELFDVVRQINAQGVTVLLVEQNVLHAMTLASRAYVIESGRIVLEGASQELLDREDIRVAYLGL